MLSEPPLSHTHTSSLSLSLPLNDHLTVSRPQFLHHSATLTHSLSHSLYLPLFSPPLSLSLSLSFFFFSSFDARCSYSSQPLSLSIDGRHYFFWKRLCLDVLGKAFSQKKPHLLRALLFHLQNLLHCYHPYLRRQTHTHTHTYTHTHTHTPAFFYSAI